MEGPSLVILADEMQPFLGQKISQATGLAPLDMPLLSRETLVEISTWGKHFILHFEEITLRIHFLLFGSYTINKVKKADLRLSLIFPTGYVNFYTCSIKAISKKEAAAYDWSIDVMSDQWKPEVVRARLEEKPHRQICDALMDQQIFSGLGNIIKNEILFMQGIHPEAPVGSLNRPQIDSLIDRARSYSRQFYEWKKMDVLRKHWLVFRQKQCPVCRRSLEFRKTGEGARLSYFCLSCQTFPNHRQESAEASLSP